MEDADGILLLSLRQAGVALPEGCSSASDFDAKSLIDVCAGCLRLIESKHATNFPSDSTQGVSTRFRVCTNLSVAIQQMGYREELSFQQLMYPTEADTRRLLRFFVDKLPQAAGAPTARSGTLPEGDRLSVRKTLGAWQQADSRLAARLSTALSRKGGGGGEAQKPLFEAEKVPFRSQKLAAGYIVGGLGKPGLRGSLWEGLPSLATTAAPIAKKGRDEEEGEGEGQEEEEAQAAAALWEELRSLHERWTAVAAEVGTAQEQVAELEVQLAEARAQSAGAVEEARQRAGDLALLERAAELLDSGRTVSEIEEDLGRAREGQAARRADLEAEWEAVERELLDRTAELESISSVHLDEIRAMEARECQLAAEANHLASLAQARADEAALLAADVAHLPRSFASVGTYMRRIMELVRNARRQEADVSRIVSETRAAQRENNAVQERLKRSFAVVDELVFRDAKKDPVCRQAYVKLSKIHESFRELNDQVFQADKVAREIADVEAKLRAMEHRSGDTVILEKDLEAVKTENKTLESKLQAILGR